MDKLRQAVGLLRTVPAFRPQKLLATKNLARASVPMSTLLAESYENLPTRKPWQLLQLLDQDSH